MVADLFVQDRVAFVLLVHRRDDGALAEELYHSVRDPGGDWQDADHLSGGLVGFDLTAPSATRDVLRGHSTAVVSEAGSLVYTGRTSHDDGYEFIRFFELLVADTVNLVLVEQVPADSEPEPEPAPEARSTRRRATSPLMLFALRPGDHLRVQAARDDGASVTRVGEAVVLRHAPD